jgi:hypothetical protein
MGDFNGLDDFDDFGVPGEAGDQIPLIGFYRQIGLHNLQSPARIRRVKADIDRVYALREDVDALYRFAGNIVKAPEARLFAKWKLIALWNEATERRRERPNFDRERLEVMVCGLDSRVWRHPFCFGTLLDHRDGVRRERSLGPDE